MLLGNITSNLTLKVPAFESATVSNYLAKVPILWVYKWGLGITRPAFKHVSEQCSAEPLSVLPLEDDDIRS